MTPAIHLPAAAADAPSIVRRCGQTGGLISNFSTIGQDPEGAPASGEDFFQRAAVEVLPLRRQQVHPPAEVVDVPGDATAPVGDGRRERVRPVLRHQLTFYLGSMIERVVGLAREDHVRPARRVRPSR